MECFPAEGGCGLFPTTHVCSAHTNHLWSFSALIRADNSYQEAKINCIIWDIFLIKLLLMPLSKISSSMFNWLIYDLLIIFKRQLKTFAKCTTSAERVKFPAKWKQLAGTEIRLLLDFEVTTTWWRMGRYLTGLMFKSSDEILRLRVSNDLKFI